VATEYRVLGPVEALVGGVPVRLAPRPRAVLAVLLLHAGKVVPASRLIDAVWGDRPPDTAANVLQSYISSLRKGLGRDAIVTRDPGYLLRLELDALDLHRFERLATDGTRALDDGRGEDAGELFREALAIWRGDALVDVAGGDVLRAAAARLDELHLVALERRAEADLACGREREIVAELEALVSEHPLRERPPRLLMLALYRCGRQADALEVYRRTRATLVDELGLEPGVALQELERSILRQEPSLDAPAQRTAGSHPRGGLVVAALEPAAVSQLVALAEFLARAGDREVVVASTVAVADALADAVVQMREVRGMLAEKGVEARTAAFTSLTPGADLARFATEQEADLLLVNAPERLLEDGRLLTLLDDAPCDVAVLVGDHSQLAGPILVTFTGGEHDWAAVELGAWLAQGSSARLVLLGSAIGEDGRDASRLLASASIAVQRTLGVDAEPRLVEPAPHALVEASRDAGLVVVGLTDRWRRDGVGRARTALASSPHHATLLVRRGLRPGGLAPRGSETRFTWTIAG
jgi:DNA-binding SARP family transcriptional activator